MLSLPIHWVSSLHIDIIIYHHKPLSNSGTEYKHWLQHSGTLVRVLQLSKPCPFVAKRNLYRTKLAGDPVTLCFLQCSRSCHAIYTSQLQKKKYFIAALNLYQLFPWLNSEYAFWQYFLRQGNTTSYEMPYLFHYWWQQLWSLCCGGIYVCLLCKSILFVFVLDTLSAHKYIISHQTLHTISEHQ